MQRRFLLLIVELCLFLRCLEDCLPCNLARSRGKGLWGSGTGTFTGKYVGIVGHWLPAMTVSSHENRPRPGWCF